MLNKELLFCSIRLSSVDMFFEGCVQIFSCVPLDTLNVPIGILTAFVLLPDWLSSFTYSIWIYDNDSV